MNTTYELKLNVPVDISPEEGKRLLLIKLYEIGRISLGRAAELAECSKAEFMDFLGRYKIPVFNYSPDEFEEEMKLWRK